MEDIFKEAATGIILAITYLIKTWIDKRKQAQEKAKKASNSGIEFLEEINREVKHAERKILHNFGAIRVFVMHFSNGTFTEAGLSLFKITFKHEVVKRYDVEPMETNFQETPMPDMFARAVLGVVRSGEYFIVRDALNLEDPQEKRLHSWLAAYNPEVKSVYWLELRNKSNKIVAILCMHFNLANALHDSDKERIKDIRTEIERIYHKLQQ